MIVRYVPSHLVSPLFPTITIRDSCSLKIKSPWVYSLALPEHPFLCAPSFISFRYQTHRGMESGSVRLIIARSGREGSSWPKQVGEIKIHLILFPVSPKLVSHPLASFSSNFPSNIFHPLITLPPSQKKKKKIRSPDG